MAKRARDPETNMLLYHLQCGGPLYIASAQEHGLMKEFFCGGCDGMRNPYVPNNLQHVTMGKPDQSSITLESYQARERRERKERASAKAGATSGKRRRSLAWSDAQRRARTGGAATREE